MEINISNGSLTATINYKGAELISLKDATGIEYIWEGNPEYWGKHSPVLFPIVGTLKDNAYYYKGKRYNLNRHGFARDNNFIIKQQTQDSVTFILLPTEDTLANYPFDFELEIKYTLQDNLLLLEYTVGNNSSYMMPFSIGAHPAFALPGDFKDYSLLFEKPESLLCTQLESDLLSENTILIPTNNGVLPLKYDLFENDALILKKIESGYVDICKDETPFLRVNFHGFPHLGIWTKPNAPFLCIEPWQGYSDPINTIGNIEEKEGIIMLQSSNKYLAGFSIEILR